ncbi:MAG: four helix bundle protein [Armatimonadetes bacterium]|nr:four helix bundle protein [Armatimonadota bacterium]
MSATIKSFRDLRVWQAGMDLVEEVYRLTKTFPSQELYGLASQIQRSAVSIPSNIAEGHTREHGKEYLNHISMAQGSLAELQTQLEIAARLGYLSQEQLSEALNYAMSLARQLYALRNGVAKSLAPNTQHPTPNTL